ncbi:hypothetical protein F0562_027188 [Nyssa sinensis]|uniref:Uncharacterized protein n=1 Tax=Nyssa sinensis TaxID=561372 RepID=A0A5J5B4N2_9ASTE|nr:hypothetical protein F0562_027188 [Nyssa sinensis]
MHGCTARLGIQNAAHGDDDIDSIVVKFQEVYVSRCCSYLYMPDLLRKGMRENLCFLLSMSYYQVEFLFK